MDGNSRDDIISLPSIAYGQPAQPHEDASHSDATCQIRSLGSQWAAPKNGSMLRKFLLRDFEASRQIARENHALILLGQAVGSPMRFSGAGAMFRAGCRFARTAADARSGGPDCHRQ